MAVPKKKTSKSKRGMRRSHQNHKPINVIVNSKGIASLPGHIAMDGTYGGKLIISEKRTSKKEETTEPNA
jgi:large subunit ribosomal protein L32